jgi:hypothetical protein
LKRARIASQHDGRSLLTERQSEELFAVSEQEHDEVMQLTATEQDDFTGYREWSGALDDSAESENFVIVNGQLRHKPEPPSRKVGGFEV